MSEAELEPCPFCGTTCHNVVWPRLIEGRMVAKIECFTDFCYATITADSPSLAIAAWNRRAKPEGEPVAWQRRLRNTAAAEDHPHAQWSDWRDCDEERVAYTKATGGKVYGYPELEAEIRPLYASPVGLDREKVARAVHQAIGYFVIDGGQAELAADAILALSASDGAGQVGEEG